MPPAVHYMRAPAKSLGRCGGGLSGRRQCAQGFGVGWFGHAAFGEDSGDVAARRDVESRMRSRDIRGDSDALDVGDFLLGALLDGNVFTIGYR